MGQIVKKPQRQSVYFNVRKKVKQHIFPIQNYRFFRAV